MDIKVLPGTPYPLGATWDGNGVNFALYSDNAETVYLCLFDNATGSAEYTRICIKEYHENIWHCYIPGLKPGQLYGYRVKGPWQPEQQHLFNCSKLLLDPYARAIEGSYHFDERYFGYQKENKKQCMTISAEDNSTIAPKSIVVSNSYHWEDDKPPRISMEKSIIYEMHVKGFTRLNNHIPETLRGKFGGIAHTNSISYLKELGITAVELLPVQYFASEFELLQKGLTNYWGYNTIGFFAPDNRYCMSEGQAKINEFKDMVKALHHAGIEVILDVVYNHTAEGDPHGPTLSFRGIDNAAYYKLAKEDNGFKDYTGTGNTFDLENPFVLRLVMDSLRYWVSEMHVDGFRFDLAPALGRENGEVNMVGTFFKVIQQDPVLAPVKLIAEPWDIGEDGYHVGKFPKGWAEWNGKYRDTVRKFWKGNGSVFPAFIRRLNGSDDLYAISDRLPHSSINFITAHDGFTLHDLVSYSQKHNDTNQMQNEDGLDENHSCNHGIEGETTDEQVNILRRRQQRNLLLSLFLSRGVPMLLSGDEINNTQHGNNNAYCQDNETTWIDWMHKDDIMLHFVKEIISLRKKYPAIWTTSKREYYHADGSEISIAHRYESSIRSFIMCVDKFILLFNASASARWFTLPAIICDKSLKIIGDTSKIFNKHAGVHPEDKGRLEIPSYTLVVLLVNKSE